MQQSSGQGLQRLQLLQRAESVKATAGVAQPTHCDAGPLPCLLCCVAHCMAVLLVLTACIVATCNLSLLIVRAALPSPGLEHAQGVSS